MKAKGFTKETIRELGTYERSFPKFEVGDVINVVQRVIEKVKDKSGKEVVKERQQGFEGNVIAINNNGASSTFTVRKMSTHNVAVERIFPLYTPMIESIELIKKGDVRRAKLFYVRDRVGKNARIKEKITSAAQKASAAQDAVPAHEAETE